MSATTAHGPSHHAAVRAGARRGRRIGALPALWRWLRRRADLHHLRQMDDWQLDDIGLTRDAILPAIRGDLRARR